MLNEEKETGIRWEQTSGEVSVDRRVFDVSHVTQQLITKNVLN